MHNVAATNWYDAPTNYLVATELTDVAAPGGEFSPLQESEIFSSTPFSFGTWEFVVGTSFAAPHSTGLAALMLALNPNLHNYDMEWLQKKTADNGGLYQFGLYGHGRINADSALELLQSPYELTQGSASLYLPPGWGNIQTVWLTSPNPWMDEEDYLPPGNYIVDRYVLEANITFPESYVSPPLAWLSQTGYSNPNDPSSYHFQYQYENVSNNNMSVKTFFYHFKYRIPYQGPINMWIPHNPFELAVSHSRVGIPGGGGGPELPSVPTDLGGWYDSRHTVVKLRWDRNPSSENVDKYWLECAEEEGEFEVIEKGVPDPGTGSTVTFDHYIWEHQEAEYLRYRVRAHNNVGWGPFCDPIEVPLDIEPLRAMKEAGWLEGAPEALTLQANYPNPFNPITQIRFGLSEPSHVRLQVLNTRGQQVRSILDEDRPKGWHTVMWDGKDAYGQDAASGIYFYVLEAQGKRLLKKMVLVR